MKILLLCPAMLLTSVTAFAMGNPSAMFCNDIAQGEYVIVTDNKNNSGSQDGVCVVNHSVVSGWALYSASKLDRTGAPKEVSKNQAISAFLAGKTCEQAKGKDKTKYECSKGGRLFRMCEFKDGTAIDFTSLNLGPNAAEVQQLVKLLK